jgi:hypothetical protein
MPARRRELKPDSKGRYRPYLGFRVDAEGNQRTARHEQENRILSNSVDPRGVHANLASILQLGLSTSHAHAAVL